MTGESIIKWDLCLNKFGRVGLFIFWLINNIIMEQHHFTQQGECRFASIGYGLTPAQAFLQFQIVQGYQSILGRQVY